MEFFSELSKLVADISSTHGSGEHVIFNGMLLLRCRLTLLKYLNEGGEFSIDDDSSSILIYNEPDKRTISTSKLLRVVNDLPIMSKSILAPVSQISSFDPSDPVGHPIDFLNPDVQLDSKIYSAALNFAIIAGKQGGFLSPANQVVCVALALGDQITDCVYFSYLKFYCNYVKTKNNSLGYISREGVTPMNYISDSFFLKRLNILLEASFMWHTIKNYLPENHHIEQSFPSLNKKILDTTLEVLQEVVQFIFLDPDGNTLKLKSALGPCLPYCFISPKVGVIFSHISSNDSNMSYPLRWEPVILNSANSKIYSDLVAMQAISKE